MSLIGKYRYCAVALAATLAVPVWANYSWGQMGQFRPGIQLGIVMLVLLAEVLVVRGITRMTWGVTAAAVAGGNLLSWGVGTVLVLGVNSADPLALLGFAFPSTLLEAMIVGEVARRRSSLERHRAEWAVAAVLVANLFSAMVTYSYVWANYRGNSQPLSRIEASRMSSVAHTIRQGVQGGDTDLRAACERNGMAAALLGRAGSNAANVLRDVAPAWLPWAQMRMVREYESALPKCLDAEGQGRPMVWTGAPYFAGKRGVIFTDGRFELLGEREFSRLGAVPRAPEVTIPPPLAGKRRG